MRKIRETFEKILGNFHKNAGKENKTHTYVDAPPEPEPELLPITHEEFDKFLDDAYNDLPETWRNRMDNIIIQVEENRSYQLYGLYHGTPNRYRGVNYSGASPDVITIYEADIVAGHETDRDFVREQVRKVLWHEIGHFFGLDDKKMHELGY